MISGLVRSESPEPHDSRRTDQFSTRNTGSGSVWAIRQAERERAPTRPLRSDRQGALLIGAVLIVAGLWPPRK
jgi:hypothetical protein